MSAGLRRDLMAPRAPELPLLSHPPFWALHPHYLAGLGTIAPSPVYRTSTSSASRRSSIFVELKCALFPWSPSSALGSSKLSLPIPGLRCAVCEVKKSSFWFECCVVTISYGVDPCSRFFIHPLGKDL
ncbi:hypothetical protein LINPERHAP1_LOCUS4739, partial [Linum perenne]